MPFYHQLLSMNQKHFLNLEHFEEFSDELKIGIFTVIYIYFNTLSNDVCIQARPITL